MGAKRRRIEAGVKAKVALAAVRGDRTTSQLVSQFGGEQQSRKGEQKGASRKGTFYFPGGRKE